MIGKEDTKIISVSELNNYIKLLFDNTPTLRNIALHGEISNYNGVNRSGHIYFSLKDDKSVIKAVMFKYDTFSLSFTPKDGDNVIVYGNVSSYAPSGTYQIIVKKIELFGQGELLLKKQQLIAKLEKAGYFDEKHKLPLPNYPKSIAIITGKNSAACVDIVTNINRRYPLVDITVFYSLVQGNDAPKDLIKNLKNAIKSQPDIIIIGRGGGSLEDLSAFDDEDLVNEIYNCKIPIISAVGHEINRSICDFVADKYVSTPTGAAEAAVPYKIDLLENLATTKDLLNSIVNRKIGDFENQLSLLKSNPNLQNINHIYEQLSTKLLNTKKEINTIVTNKFINFQNNLSNYKNLLSALNPNNLLNKGYSIVFKTDVIVKSTKNVNEYDDLKIKVADGTIFVKVKEK